MTTHSAPTTVRPAPKPGAKGKRKPGMTHRRALRLAIKALQAQAHRLGPDANLLDRLNVRTLDTEAASAERANLLAAAQVLGNVLGTLAEE